MKFLTVLLALLFLGHSVSAQGLSALARADQSRTSISDGWSGSAYVNIGMSQAVPYRIYLLENPSQLVIEFETLVLDGLDLDAIDNSKLLNVAEIGQRSGRTSFISFDLTVPMRVDNVDLSENQTTAAAVLELTISQTDAATFATLVVENPNFSVLEAETELLTKPERTIIALDPGHGGVDPGAKSGRIIESDLMLLFAFELRDELRRTGLFDVILTRESDTFVGLEDRMSLARDARASAFLSLHADAVLEGYAEGFTAYVLSQKASNEADAKLAARHNRTDILNGVDLNGQGDEVAMILLEMVRLETEPKSRKLADQLVKSVNNMGSKVNSKPLRQGDFAVLRSADIPSVLLELGFLSSAADRKKLTSAEGRRNIIAGIVEGMILWNSEIASETALIRQ